MENTKSLFTFVETKKKEKMETSEILKFEDFLEQVWDYVSDYVISDEEWNDNYGFIKETTFDIYQLYLKSVDKTPSGLVYTILTPKLCGKMLESFLSNLLKHKFHFKNFG